MLDDPSQSRETASPSPLLNELADGIGTEAAMAASASWGGRRIYIPKHPTARMIAVVGETAAAWMAQAYGGDTLEIPLGPHSAFAQTGRQIAAMTAEGKSASAIAAALGIAKRTVERHRARHKTGPHSPSPTLDHTP